MKLCAIHLMKDMAWRICSVCYLCLTVGSARMEAATIVSDGFHDENLKGSFMEHVHKVGVFCHCFEKLVSGYLWWIYVHLHV